MSFLEKFKDKISEDKYKNYAEDIQKKMNAPIHLSFLEFKKQTEIGMYIGKTYSVNGIYDRGEMGGKYICDENSIRNGYCRDKIMVHDDNLSYKQRSGLYDLINQKVCFHTKLLERELYIIDFHKGNCL